MRAIGMNPGDDHRSTSRSHPFHPCQAVSYLYIRVRFVTVAQPRALHLHPLKWKGCNNHGREETMLCKDHSEFCELQPHEASQCV